MANHSEIPKFDLNESDLLLEIRPAIKEFEQQIRRGDHVTSESLIARFPQLNLDKEALLEIIYTEFVVKEELGHCISIIHHRVVEARIAARLTECLAGAIHYAHMQGIVHRDLKPANILLAPSDRPSAIPLELPNDRDPTTKTNLGYEPKLSDFGLAKRIDMNDQKTLPGHAIGTPSYMAPEQTGNSSLPTGTSCDIFSLGAVLYDMLTGRPPFNAPTVAETLRKVLHEDPISLCSLQASVPRDLETICLKCLQKEPSRRYAHDISLSKLAFLSNRTTRSRDLLEKCPPELNQLEWRYLKSTFKQELCDFDDFKSPAWAVAMSPDGKLVAASTAVWGIDRPSEICIWNIDLQQMMWTLHGHSSSIMDIEFSPDGKQLVSIGTHWRRGGAAGQIHLWNLATGESIWSDKSVDGNCVTFSRNRNRIPW